MKELSLEEANEIPYINRYSKNLKLGLVFTVSILLVQMVARANGYDTSSITFPINFLIGFLGMERILVDKRLNEISGIVLPSSLFRTLLFTLTFLLKYASLFIMTMNTFKDLLQAIEDSL